MSLITRCSVWSEAASGYLVPRDVSHPAGAVACCQRLIHDPLKSKSYREQFPSGEGSNGSSEIIGNFVVGI